MFTENFTSSVAALGWAMELSILESVVFVENVGCLLFSTIVDYDSNQAGIEAQTQYSSQAPFGRRVPSARAEHSRHTPSEQNGSVAGVRSSVISPMEEQK
ncbi:hypothetical protein [Arthrobacter sp. OV608]|uniref:hypothetical protein n=1 Tax=Arthrobacter sp. OV608 TaxID=1882768 RepID=UPI0008C7D50B|nr:hypothetical protein [Arthrobacter sp. OV608]SEQ26669.1 hypothetical protein SAMN05444745_10528 [Arthrobacter sp. OV608]